MEAMSPAENGRRGDSKGLAGMHEDAITKTSTGSVSHTSSSQCTPSVPEHVGDLVRIGHDAVVPWASTARANSSTISFDDSMCTCASM
jgi:hypothetical protein